MLDNTRPYTSGRVNVRSVSRGGVRPGAEELLRASMETHGKNKENVAASQRRARLSLPGFDLTAQNREGTPGGVDQLSADLAKGWPSGAPTPGEAATPAPSIRIVTNGTGKRRGPCSLKIISGSGSLAAGLF